MENTQKKPIPPDMLKLSERVAKDPTSKLFLPLAEEYMTLGMPGEAEAVLIEGLKNHPTYLSARVLLGKLYMGQGDRDKALAEFERVVTANPENLLAHKKLAGIYRDAGRVEEAIRSCRAVLAFNPADPEIRAILDALSASDSHPLPKGGEGEPPVAPASIAEPGPDVWREAPTESPVSVTDLHATSQEDAAAEAATESPAGIDMAERIESHRPEEQAIQPDPAVQEAAVVEESDASTAGRPISAEKATLEQDVPVVVLPDEESDLSSVFPEIEETPSSEPIEGGPPAADRPLADGSEEHIPTVILEDKGETLGDFVATEPSFREEPSAPAAAIWEPEGLEAGEPPSSNDPLATEALAELYIKQGFYEKGIEIYRTILGQDPRRSGVRQKLDDVITLTNLLGPRSPGEAEVGEGKPEEREISVMDGRDSPVEEPAISVSKPESPAAGSREEKIRKLEAWLERIQARSRER